MKNTFLRNAMYATVIAAGLSFTSCKDKGSETEGSEDATEVNGQNSGTEGTMDNDNSGSTPGTDMGAGTATATDTVTGTTTNGNSPAAGTGDRSANP